MTKIAIRTQAGIVAWVFLWVSRGQHELSARVHVAGDERARQCGWEVTERTGRFSFGDPASTTGVGNAPQLGLADASRRYAPVTSRKIIWKAAARGVSDE